MKFWSKTFSPSISHIFYIFGLFLDFLGKPWAAWEDGDAHLSAHLIHLLGWLFFWGNCGIVLWLLGLLELMEMHSCPPDSQASSLAFLGKLCACFFFGFLWTFVLFFHLDRSSIISIYYGPVWPTVYALCLKFCFVGHPGHWGTGFGVRLIFKYICSNCNLQSSLSPLRHSIVF